MATKATHLNMHPAHATGLKPNSPTGKRVLLLIESSRSYGRGLLKGIASYLRAHPNWDVLHLERGLNEDIPEQINRQSFDGVIARIENRQLHQSITEMGVPAVDLRANFEPFGGTSFDTDPAACAHLAVEHFRERGHRNLAYCGYSGLKFSDQRCDAFVDQAQANGLNIFVYSMENKRNKKKLNDTLSWEAKGEIPEQRMIDWVASLPKPIGLFACNDTRGRQALRAVQLAGCASPEDVAVLGVDNDEVICELASPSMSSIEPDTHRMGFEAAERLEEMMAGKTLPSEFTLIPPVRVITRQSTDLLAVEDPEVAKAIQHIRERALSGLSVAELSKHLAISRVTLERRFRESLNRSPREEIERIRLGHVRILLIETNYSLKKIAQLTGYQTDSYLATVFRRREGCSPGEYRKTMQHSSR